MEPWWQSSKEPAYQWKTLGVGLIPGLEDLLSKEIYAPPVFLAGKFMTAEPSGLQSQGVATVDMTGWLTHDVQSHINPV